MNTKAFYLSLQT